ncbi:MAG: CHAD domain-containing protein [Acidobacteriaceae bacterium]|nr:CHAD domain-containing protein [Acidobacteriaceae bacterium]MBV9180721.1 CHAD domain-containing protein [Acidobacteriota bacterium]
MVHTSASGDKGVGLGYWMQAVLDLSARVAGDFSSDPVHDLRTALRRCRSLADGIRAFDPDPAWKKMRRSGKQLFSSLGNLRDIHVMLDWVGKLSSSHDLVSKDLGAFLSAEEEKAKTAATVALAHFDRKQWKVWASVLPRRAARITIDSPIFAHLALERWQQAHELHRQALRNRSRVGFHRLRIGLKRLRYTLENFLPRLYGGWGEDLKQLQDLLGDVHDLDVLWQAAVRVKVFRDSETRERWHTRVQEERSRRLEGYRQKMLGVQSCWPVWRSSLPAPDQLRSLSLERLRTWASFLDTNTSHAEHVAQLATQLYDGLPAAGILHGRSQWNKYRDILRAAAYMHDVGRSKSNRGHHKQSARLIRRLVPPLSWSADEIHATAAVVRYHRGALPRDTHTKFAALSPSKQRLVEYLAGILRLACACDWQRDNQIRRVSVEAAQPVVKIRAEGYREYTALAEHLAAARHLLELAYQRPVFIVPTDDGRRNAA